MIKNPEQLAVFIGGKLAKEPGCRIFCDTLNECWDMPKVEQAAAIQAFAATHGWGVLIHEPFNVGVVAEFGIA